MKIAVKIKNVYGKTLIYPACDHASLVLKLLNQKAFTEQNIKDLKNMGYEIDVVPEKLEN